jgi:chemotaxis response regulator CheB
MPKEAIKVGGVDKVLPLDAIASATITHVSRS